MLPPGGESDLFLAIKVLKLVGCRREKYVFCYVLMNELVRRKIVNAAIRVNSGELNE